MDRKFNALKTGAFAREVLLPWESRAEFEEHRADIFADLRPKGKIQTGLVDNIVENRFLRERQRRTTAIATQRHPFGRALEESGARSWQDALAVVKNRGDKHQETLQRIASKLDQLAEASQQAVEVPEHDRETRAACKKIAKACEAMFELLADIKGHLDDEKNFFAQYSPKHLQQRIQLENALDAQFDKMMGRLEVQQARIAPQEMSVGNSLLAQSPAKHDQQIDPAIVARLPDGEDDRSIDDLTVEDLANETDSMSTIPDLPDESDDWDSKE
jgi:hypothetical protein